MYFSEEKQLLYEQKLSVNSGHTGTSNMAEGVPPAVKQ